MKRMDREFAPIIIETEITEQRLNWSFAQKKSLYGITREQFLALALSQDNACAGCGVDATGVTHLLQVDHDHYTNEIRGLLCTGCNTALEWLDDNPSVIRKLADYMESSGTGMFIPETR
jgi:hypothetical protein